MSKRQLIGIIIVVILAIFFISFFVFSISDTTVSEQTLNQKFIEFEAQLNEMKKQGYNVTEAEMLAKKAKQAFNSNDYHMANDLIDKAFESLMGNGATIITPLVPNAWIYEGIIYETHPYYYNGTFKDITNQIPALSDLGVKTIWLLPIWEHEPLPPKGDDFRYGFSYHIYDYYNISPEFGSEEEFKELVDTAHSYNMKVILEMVTVSVFEKSTVYNNNWTMNIPLSELQGMGLPLKYRSIDGVDYVYYNCANDERYDIVGCDLFGRIEGDRVILLTYPYYAFGYAVDRSNPEVIDYFTEVAGYYVEEYDIDGWRIDAPADNWNPNIISGDHSSVELLKSAKKEILKIKPDAIFLSEFQARSPHPEEYLEPPLPDPVFDEMCDLSNSYYFRDELMKSIDKIDSDKLLDINAKERIWYNRARTRNVELHGQQRINKLESELNKPIVVLISTIPGVPQIQAGQEIGAVNSYLSDAPVDWINGDYELREFYQKVFKIRNNNNALKYGSLENVFKSGDDTVAFSRSYKNEKVVVVINFKDKTVTSTLDLPFEKGEILFDVLNNERFFLEDPDNFRIEVSAFGSRILILEKGAL